MNKPIETYKQSELSRAYFEHDAKVNSLNAQISALHISIANERHDNIILQKKLRDSKQINEYLWALVGAVIALGIGLTMVASAT